MIIDAGVHVWRPEAPDRPWMPGRKAHLPEPLTYEKFSAMMKEAGVEHAILVPPSWEGDRVDYSLEAAQKYPDRFAVMGRFPINKPEERSKLETWRDQRGMLGVRLTLHHEWDRTWMQDGTADWFWPAAERLGIPVMLNAPYTHKEIGEVAARHRRLRIIMDHLGARTTQKDDLLKAASESTATLAKHSNVYVKLTLVPVFSTAPYPYNNIHPYIRHLVEAFGPKRCFWGTDASAMLERTTCSYGNCVKLFTEHMDFLSASDKEGSWGAVSPNASNGLNPKIGRRDRLHASAIDNVKASSLGCVASDDAVVRHGGFHPGNRSSVLSIAPNPHCNAFGCRSGIGYRASYSRRKIGCSLPCPRACAKPTGRSGCHCGACGHQCAS